VPVRRLTAIARDDRLRALIEIQPGRPAFGAGLRMAVAVVAPLAAAIALGHLASGLMIAVGAMEVGLTDDGSPYRQRALHMGAATVATAVVFLTGTIVGDRTWLAALIMLLLAFACGLTNMFSSGAATVGSITLISYAIGAGIPADLATARQRALQFLIGGAWALVLSNVLWPLYRWRPIERSVASAYRALGGLIEPRFSGSRAVGADPLTGAVAEAMESLVASRAGRRGPSPTAERLLLLLRLAERGGEVLGAIDEAVSIPESGRFDPGASWTGAVARVRAALVDAATAIAAALETGGGDVSLDDLHAALGALGQGFDAVRLRATTPDALPALNAEAETMRLAMTLGQLLHDAADACRALRTGAPASFELDPAAADEDQRPVDVICQNLTFESAGLRHALRLAASAAAAVVLDDLTPLGHGYWITLTVIVILKPTYGATMARARQRVAGTVLGALFAALLAGVVTGEIAMLAIVAALSLLTFSLLPLNYGLYTFFLTPLIVLLLDLGRPGTLSVAADRALDTVIGGALAMMGGYLLWPASERLRLPETLADVALALREYAGAALDAYVTTPDAGRLGSGAARATLTISNAESALSRLVTEPAGHRQDAAPALAFVGAARRIRAELAALALHAGQVTKAGRLEGLPALSPAVDVALAGVATSVRARHVPLPLTGFAAAVEPLRAQLAALYAQRASELAGGQTRTPTRDAVADVSLAAHEVIRMTTDIEVLRGATARLAGAER